MNEIENKKLPEVLAVINQLPDAHKDLLPLAGEYIILSHKTGYAAGFSAGFEAAQNQAKQAGQGERT